MIQSLWNDGTCSWIMIVNGTNKYVTEMTVETQDDHIDALENVQGNLQSKTETNISTDVFFNDYVGSTLSHDRLTRVVAKCQDCFDTILQYLEKKSLQSNSKSWHRCFVQNLRVLSIGQFEHGWISCRKEEGLRRDFSVMWIHSMLISSYTSSNSRSLWRKTHQSNIARQRVVTERLRRAHLPRWKLPRYVLVHPNLDWFRVPKDVKKGRHAVFFTAVDPIFIDHHRDKDYDVTQPRIAVHKHNWKIHQNTIYLCAVRVAQSNGCSSIKRDETRSSFTTLLVMCIEKMEVMKSGEELRDKTYPYPTTPQRVVLKPNLNYERQDTTSSDARTSSFHSDKHKENSDGGTCKETCRGEMDFRIQGLSHSAVQEHDHVRKKGVQKLIHLLENHPNKEAPRENLQQKRMGNMEYFEIYEITPNRQCTNCMTYSPRKIVYCTCGTCLRPSYNVRKSNSDRYDVLSIPN